MNIICDVISDNSQVASQEFQTARYYNGYMFVYTTMQSSDHFLVVEKLVDRRNLCGSRYIPVGVYSMLYINILCTNITIQNILQYGLII